MTYFRPPNTEPGTVFEAISFGYIAGIRVVRGVNMARTHYVDCRIVDVEFLPDTAV